MSTRILKDKEGIPVATVTDQGPLLPNDIARDLWVKLHDARNSQGFCCPIEQVLNPDEEALYQTLTRSFLYQSAIAKIEVETPIAQPSTHPVPAQSPQSEPQAPE